MYAGPSVEVGSDTDREPQQCGIRCLVSRLLH
jgi:hypothetical protein